MQQFCHTPLPDPAKYIRLLTVLSPVEPDHELSFRILTWPIETAPQYNATSYTWGERNMVTIRVNQQLLEVRQNCYDALVQALNFDRIPLLWIDSICIDQTDVHEKNVQVRRMYEIYQSAARVLACVGDTEDSQWLSRVCRDTGEEAEQDVVHQDRFDEEYAAELLERILRRNGHPDRETFLERTTVSFQDLGWRPYWARLWIVQEIDAGGSRTEILCGSDNINWLNLCVVGNLIARSYSNRDPLSQLDLCNVSGAVGGSFQIPKERPSLSDQLSKFSRLECQDPRDRLYGTIALIDWQKEGILPIMPDYSRSAWSLAGELLTKLSDLKKSENIIECLEINSNDPELHALVQERLSPFSWAVHDVRVTEWLSKNSTVAMLWRDARGTLQCALGSAENNEYGIKRLLEPYDELGSPGYEWCEKHARRPKKVFNGLLHAVALVCGETLAGDMLVLDSFGAAGFVLRPNGGKTLDIVGNARGIHCYDLGPMHDQRKCLTDLGGGEMPLHDTFKTNLQVSGTWEDILSFRFLGVGCSEPWREPQNRLLHLMTRPVNSPKGAAMFVH